MRYKIIVAYDGTDYFGWQIQSSKPTIAGTLQSSFKRVFKQDISIVGASRTDTGVHALGQVASFVSDIAIDPETMRMAWNKILPPAIMIRSLEVVSDDFHPQRNVKNKTYTYTFYRERPLPQQARYGWYVPYDIDIEKLRSGLQVFVGTHDFRAFCTMEDGDTRSTIKTIENIEVSNNKIIIIGHSFLHYMIRRIVGAAMQVAYRPDLSIKDLEKALVSKDPRTILAKAPACGLELREIVYRYSGDPS